MSKPLRVGLVGSGFMSGVHGRNLKKLPGVTVAAICDVNEAAAANLRLELGATFYGDFDRMLGEAKLDAVVIAIPPFAHNGQFEKAAAAGVPVFIEKPIALTLERAESMVESARKSGIVSQVGYHMRFADPVRRLKAAIDNGTAGAPTLFLSRYLCNSLHAPWWRDVTKCGGQVFEQVIHHYDLAMHLFGTPAKVSGLLANLGHREVEGYTVEDTSIGTVQFKNGSLASLTASNNVVPWEWVGSFSVIATKLTAHFANENTAEFIHTAQDPVVRENFKDGPNAYEAEMTHFVAAVRGEAKPMTTIEEGYASLKLVARMVESAKQGGTPLDY